jgi:hypothetical protein
MRIPILCPDFLLLLTLALHLVNRRNQLERLFSHLFHRALFTLNLGIFGAVAVLGVRVPIGQVLRRRSGCRAGVGVSDFDD